MNRQSNMEKWAALYVRLSRDDENEGDSNSISHQIELLQRYCKERSITNCRVYKDDGFSGTSFNRPGFQEMLRDIEAGTVDTVIVKDMSRFGRNYLEVGIYTEVRFPEMGVRFIAVNDGVDSDRQFDNDFTPFRNIINEWYAKDTSKKIRSVFYNKGMSGQRLCTHIPYGYVKGTDGNLAIDEETAPVVREIFYLCAEGNGTGRIARILRSRGIPTPGTIEFRRTGRTRNYHPDDPCRWNESSIANILAQDAYLGRTTNFKTTKLSYKSRKTVLNPPEKQVTFENTHEAIIDPDTWEAVQKARQQRRRPTKMGDMGMFSGLVYCADCGQKLYLCRTTSWTHEQECYNCSTYRGHKGCSAHYIRTVVLEALVLQNIQRVIAYAQLDEKRFVQGLLEEKDALRHKEQETAKRRLARWERRIAEIDGIMRKLYEDSYTGKLSDERFMKLSQGYEAEQAGLKASAEELRAAIDSAQEQAKDVERFTRLVRKNLYPTELTPALLHSLVDKIVVHEKTKDAEGHRRQKIEIFYKFIGASEFSPEYSQYCKK